MHGFRRDPRLLNLAVFEADLEPAMAPSESFQESVDFASDSQLEHTLYNGIFPDRWLAGKASVEMRAPRQSRSLRIRGLAPGGTGLVFPLHLRIYADDEPLGDAMVRVPGNFDVSLALPDAFRGDGARDVRIGIEPEAKCFVTKSDSRCLTIRLKQLSFGTSVPRGLKFSDAKAQPARGRVSASLIQNSLSH